METATTMSTEAVMEMLPIGHRTLAKRKRNHWGSLSDTVMHDDITMKKMIWKRVKGHEPYRPNKHWDRYSISPKTVEDLKDS